MAGGGKKVTVGYRYLMKLHMGLCRGPVNFLTQIRVADRFAWGGTVGSNTSFEINQPNLFGGDEKEGGIVGTLGVWMGGPSQVFSSAFKTLMGGRVPDFKGVCTLTFDGQITSNNPYPKPWEFRVSRYTEGWDRGTAWYPEKARILVEGDIEAMNPAHIIYECLTDRVWGRGIDPSDIDEDYFVAAANTLCEELFGLCMQWVRQQDINEFIDSVLSHIGAVRFTNVETGKIAIRLLRGGYDASALPTFTYDSGLLEITEDETGGGDSAYSEVIVNYVDAREGNDASEREQSIALMQALGDVASTTASYPGIPTAALAKRVARRDLEQQAAFLKRFNVVLDRRAWRLNPGSLFRVTAADRGMSGVVLRVGTIRDSAFTDGRIQITAIEDVFGLPASGYTTPETGGWTPPDTEAVAVSDFRLEEAPYRDLTRSLTASEVAALPDTAGYIAIYAKQPTSTAISYDIASSAGDTMTIRGSGDWTQVYALTSGIGLTDTELQFSVEADLSRVTVGSAALIDDEIVRIDAVDNTLKTITVARGCADTIPQAHTVATLVWFYEDEEGTDGRQYDETEDVDVRLLTITSTDRLEIGEVSDTTITMAARQFRPYPPGDVKVDGVGYAEHVEGYAVADGTDVVFSWTHRDRLLQDDQLVEHDAASVGPEAGTTYTLRIYDDVTLLRTESGLTGTSFTYTAAMIASDGEPVAENWTVRLKAVRDSYDSWQEYEFPVYRRRSVSLTPAPGVISVTGFVPASQRFTPPTGTVEIVGYVPIVSP